MRRTIFGSRSGQRAASNGAGALRRRQSKLRRGVTVVTALIAYTTGIAIFVVSGATPSFAATPGTITTVAGGDAPGPLLATSVALGPEGVAASGGNFYVADQAGNVVRKVDSAGNETVVAGDGTDGYSGDGGAATAAELAEPTDVAFDHSGNLLIADTANNRIRVVAASSGTFYGQAMAQGDIYTIAGNGASGFSGDGGAATSAEFDNATHVVVDPSGNVLVADTYNNRIRVVAASSATFYGQSMTKGDIYTIAGTGTGGYSGDSGAATSAELADPNGVAVDASGNLLIADEGNERIRVVAASSATFYGQSMTKGDIYTIAGTGAYGYSGDSVAATSAELYEPYGVAVDTSGNVLIADTNNNRVRVVATSSGTFYGQSMVKGDIYTIAGTGGEGSSGDGGPATSAELNVPWGVAVDTSGNVLIAGEIASFGWWRQLLAPSTASR